MAAGNVPREPPLRPWCRSRRDFAAAGHPASCRSKACFCRSSVYDPERFRPIVDVDLLVPEGRFGEGARCGYDPAGVFSDERWEPGGWQSQLEAAGAACLSASTSIIA